MTDEISKRRWDKAKGSNDLTPIDSLHRLIDEVNSGEIKLKHVVVVYGCDPREGGTFDGLGFFQSGPYSTIKTVGLLEYVKHILIDHLEGE